SLGEIRLIQSQAKRDSLHQRVTEPGHRGQVFENRFATEGDVSREEIGSGHRRLRLHQWMVVRQFGAEIETFLQIRLTGSQLAANGKVSSPGPAATFHP